MLGGAERNGVRQRDNNNYSSAAGVKKMLCVCVGWPEGARNKTSRRSERMKINERERAKRHMICGLVVYR